MRSSALIQIFSIALMLLQSFLLPVIIGLESFGAQIYLLSFVFIIQAFAEPFFQALYNETHDASESPNLFFPLVIGCIGLASFFVCLVSPPIGDKWTSLALFGAIYLVQTSLVSLLYAADKRKNIATAGGILLIGYGVGVSFSILFWPGFELIFGNIAGFGASAIYTGYCVFRSWSPSFIPTVPNLNFFTGALLYRLPVISFNSGSTLLLGLTGMPNALIGEFRVFLSALNGARYVNLVPLGSLQAHIKVLFDRRQSYLSSKTVRAYIGSVVVFAVVLAVFFPLLFSAVFYSAPFNRIYLLLAPLYIFVQPLSYLVFLMRSGRVMKTGSLHVGAGGLILAVFWLFLVIWDKNPYTGLVVAAMSTLVLYILALSKQIRRNK